LDKKYKKDKKSMKLLFVTCRFPYPVIGGDRTKSFNLLKNLAKNHEVHLISNAENGPLTEEQKNKVISLGIIVHEVPFNKTKAIIRSISLLFSNKPLEVTFYDSREIRKRTREIFNKIKPDIAISFFMRTAESTASLPCKRILIAEDCRLLYQSRSANESNSLLQKTVRLFEVYKLKKYEPKIISKFDCVTFVTETDLKNAKLTAPNINGEILTCGVDINEFKINEKPREKTILFAGKLDVLANIMMAKKVVLKILPLVSKRIKGIKCEIVGGSPTKNVLNLESNNVKIIKDVPSLVPFFQKAGVFVHPHSGASGIQNKLLEAMACGCPVVTTKTGTQGIPIEHGIHGYITQNKYEMASCAIDLLDNPDKAIIMGNHARKLMEENFTWEIISKKMESILIKVINI
jgi:glycosyltransferase involved in cell wall biosynthesis